MSDVKSDVSGIITAVGVWSCFMKDARPGVDERIGKLPPKFRRGVSA